RGYAACGQSAVHGAVHGAAGSDAGCVSWSAPSGDWPASSGVTRYKAQQGREQVVSTRAGEEAGAMLIARVHTLFLGRKRGVKQVQCVVGEGLVLLARHKELGRRDTAKVAVAKLYVLKACRTGNRHHPVVAFGDCSFQRDERTQAGADQKESGKRPCLQK